MRSHPGRVRYILQMLAKPRRDSWYWRDALMLECTRGRYVVDSWWLELTQQEPEWPNVKETLREGVESWYAPFVAPDTGPYLQPSSLSEEMAVEVSEDLANAYITLELMPRLPYWRGLIPRPATEEALVDAAIRTRRRREAREARGEW